MVGGALTTVVAAAWAFYLYVKPEPMPGANPPQSATTIGSITGNVTIQNTVNQIVAGGPDGLEQIVKNFAAELGVSKQTVQNLLASTAPDDVSRKIAEMVAAQKAATLRGIGITPQAAYYLGLLSAYRRDYDTALAYFREAVEQNSEYTDAFEAIAWLQQYRAMSDINLSGNYRAAMSKLQEARDAAAHTDPLDPKALALRGFIFKTLAQLAEADGKHEARDHFYEEAARLFGRAAELAPADPSAQNGLGNVEYARGNADAAIAAYTRAIELAPSYTAAYHDLALALEVKMHNDPQHAQQWCQGGASGMAEILRTCSE